MRLPAPKPPENVIADSASHSVGHLSVSQWIDRFEIALQNWSPAQSVALFLPDPSHPQRGAIIAEVLRVYLEWCWEHGQTDSLDRLIEQFDWLRTNPEVFSQIAFEDFRLRSSHPDARSIEYYRDQLGVDTGQWQDWLAGAENQLGSRFTPTESGLSSTISAYSQIPGPTSGSDAPHSQSSAETGLSLTTATSRLPQAGESFGDFDLLWLIGEGAFSRVFVARQRSLANRLIVVKVTRTPLGESQHLARLQHANIMPLYSAQKVAGLYLLVMPFLGSITLKDLIAFRFGSAANGSAANGSAAPGSRGLDSRGLGFKSLPEPDEPEISLAQYLADQRQSLFRNLSQFEQTGLLEDNAGLQERVDEFLGRLDWETAILRIFASLADALGYAHRRGIQQRDIKPANILIGFDGQPILLDFNLSRISKTDRPEATRAVGGTLPYMAPEHRLAMQTGIDNLTPAADIFSMGVVLLESLTGVRPPAPAEQSSSNDRSNTALSTSAGILKNAGLAPAVQSIISKAIEPVRDQRYLSAAELQSDLRRHLDDLPLSHADNPSRWELWQKFRRRNRRLFSVGSLILLSSILGIAALALGGIWLNGLRTMEARDRYSEFVRTAHRGEAELFLADGGSRELGLELVQQSIQSATSESVPTAPAAWIRYLDAARQRDVLDIRGYLVRLIQNTTATSTNRSLEDSSLPVFPLASEATAGAEVSSMTQLEAATAAFFRREFAGAIEILEAEIRQHPQRFVSWFLKAKCEFDLRQFRESERSFALALTIQPDSVPALVGQGLSHFGLTQFTESETCFREALLLQPDHFAARFNLALVLEKQARYTEALTELEYCSQIRPSSTRVEMTRSRIARLAGNTELADQALSRVKSTQPDEPDGWVLRGLARLTESPESALQDFAEAQRFPSTRFVAGQNRAHVLSEFLGRSQEAIDVLTTLIEEDPNFLPALSGRAVLAARLKQSEQALSDLALLRQKPLSPQLHYQIACVYALLVETDSRHESKALEHLAIASQPAYGGHVIASDKDLDSIRKNAKFKAILQGINAGNSLRENHP